MVRNKRRYILVYAPSLNKEKCKAMNIYLIEKDNNYAIVRCYLSDLNKVRDALNKQNMITLSTSGTLKALRSKKHIICKFESNVDTTI